MNKNCLWKKVYLWVSYGHHFHISLFISFHFDFKSDNQMVCICCNIDAQSFSWYLAALAICHRFDWMEICCWCSFCCCWLGRRCSMTRSWCGCKYSFDRFHAEIGLQLWIIRVCVCVYMVWRLMHWNYWFDSFCVVFCLSFFIFKSPFQTIQKERKKLIALIVCVFYNSLKSSNR